MLPFPARRFALVLTAAVGLSSLAAGCSSDGPDSADPRGGSSSGPGTGAGTPDLPPTLDAAWTATGVRVGATPTATSDELLVFTDAVADKITTLDRATGEEVSRFRAPRGISKVCTGSPQLARGHVLGLLMTERGAGAPCTVAAALDVRTGTLVWKRSLPTTDPDLKPGETDRYHEGRTVAVGDGVLVATTTCAEARRLSLRDGRPLGSIAPRDVACRNRTATDGKVIAALDYDVEPVDYEDPTGNGFFPAEDGAGLIALYDVATGRRTWTHAVADHNTAGVAAVVSSDPVILTTIEDGRATTRLWGRNGKPGAFVGPSKASSAFADPLMRVVGRTDDLIVVTFPDAADSSVLHAYDLATGEERWQLVPPGYDSPYAQPASASVTDDGLLVGVAGRGGTDLLRYDIDQPAAPTVVGRVEGPIAAFVGDLVLTSGERLSAYTVPTEAVQEDYTPQTALGEVAWQDSDVLPSDVVGACRTVSAETLDDLALHWKGVPEPVDCHWSFDRLEYVTRSLDVSVHVATPSLGSDGEDLSADDAASAFVEQLIEQSSSTDDKGSVLTPLAQDAALGDEAWSQFDQVEGGGLDGFPVRMVTRWHNVVVDVTATQGLDLEDRAYALAPYDQLQDTVYAATADVLGPLGATVFPTRSSAGRANDVGDPCPAAAPTANELTPGLRLVRGHTGSRQRACVWAGEDSDQLVVVATTARGGFDGQSADDRATRTATYLNQFGGAEKRVKGYPGLTSVRRYTDDDYLVWDATSRVGNLVVWVHLALGDNRLDRAGMEAAVKQTMSRSLAAARASTG